MSLAELFKDLTREKHCVRYSAVDVMGNECPYYSVEARRWCALGWVDKLRAARYVEELRGHAFSLGYNGASDANDEMGYAFIESIRKNCR